ncbi:hypothetical protein [Frankia sp. AgB32]|uniref:hypothetical protein n=1 Tax=Frankia sp. AgB32 TaxID=631119 RepID=UPI00200D8D85|nr:hypothetical protein [Frankia sp. AgB32]MCK9893429.1 hypothetical protein [Frankia sp. AgB32]
MIALRLGKVPMPSARRQISLLSASCGSEDRSPGMDGEREQAELFLVTMLRDTVASGSGILGGIHRSRQVFDPAAPFRIHSGEQEPGRDFGITSSPDPACASRSATERHSEGSAGPEAPPHSSVAAQSVHLNAR